MVIKNWTGSFYWRASAKTGLELYENVIHFENFVIIPRSKSFFAVVCKFDHRMITSGKSLEAAKKKAQLLEIGYQYAKEIF